MMWFKVKYSSGPGTEKIEGEWLARCLDINYRLLHSPDPDFMD